MNATRHDIATEGVVHTLWTKSGKDGALFAACYGEIVLRRLLDGGE